MQTELLRALLLEYLRTVKDDKRQSLQYQHCLNNVEGIAKTKCPGQFHREDDGVRLKHVIWDLILQRVLIPGTPHSDSMSDGWPFLSLTGHGRKVLAETGPVPYDPDGYLARVEQTSNGLHPTVKRYLEESLSTFRTGNYLASAVMLGAASEMVFVNVCESITKAIADRKEGEKFQEKTAPRKKMVERIGAVIDWLRHKKDQLPEEWQRQEQIGLIDKVADLIRNRRNDAGHPRDPPATLDHEEMYALLMVFPRYCQKIHELKHWLDGNPGAIT